MQIRDVTMFAFKTNVCLGNCDKTISWTYLPIQHMSFSEYQPAKGEVIEIGLKAQVSPEQ